MEFFGVDMEVDIPSLNKDGLMQVLGLRDVMCALRDALAAFRASIDGYLGDYGTDPLSTGCVPANRD